MNGGIERTGRTTAEVHFGHRQRWDESRHACRLPAEASTCTPGSPKAVWDIAAENWPSFARHVRVKDPDPHKNVSGDGNDCAFGADDQRSASGVRTYGVELYSQLFFGGDAGRVGGREEVEDEVLANEEESLRRRRLHARLLSCAFCTGSILLLQDCGLVHAAVVGGAGKVCERMDCGESPGFAAVIGEGEVGAVVVGIFVVAASDNSVQRVAEGDGENSGGVGAVEDGSIEDLPGLSAIGRVEDAGGAASGGEPDVGVGG